MQQKCTTRGSSRPLIVLPSFVRFDGVPCYISVQLWYLNDGTFAGSRSAVADLLDLLATQGPSFGLTLNLKKCEVFWPSGDPSFPTFLQEVSRPLQISDGVELPGSPIFGSSKFFDDFTDSLFDKVC